MILFMIVTTLLTLYFMSQMLNRIESFEKDIHFIEDHIFADEPEDDSDSDSDSDTESASDTEMDELSSITPKEPVILDKIEPSLLTRLQERIPQSPPVDLTED